MSDIFCTSPQAMVEQLMLELSAGVSLDEAARVLGIPVHEALHIMQQHAMEIRLTNLERAWADALLKMPADVREPAAPSALSAGESVVTFSLGADHLGSNQEAARLTADGRP